MKNEMIKRMQKKEGGFTLVELIVVLVILAILAAILVPTLLGYIDKARDEKNFSTAQTVRVAAQAVSDSIYAKDGTVTTTITEESATAQGEEKTVADLAGATFDSCSFTVDGTTGAITDGNVVIDGSTYEWDGTAWTVSK